MCAEQSCFDLSFYLISGTRENEHMSEVRLAQTNIRVGAFNALNEL